MLSSPSKTRSSSVESSLTSSPTVSLRVESIQPAQQYFFLQNAAFSQILEKETNKNKNAPQNNGSEQKNEVFWNDLLAMCMPSDYSELISQFPYEQHLKEQMERLFTEAHLFRLQQLYQSFLKTPPQAQSRLDSFDNINDRIDRIRSQVNTLV